MSLPDQEARALNEAWECLMDLSSGQEKRVPSATRARARRIAKHFPLAAGERWLDAETRNIPPAEPALRCDGHYGPGSLREWDECPLCNPDDTRVLPPGSGDADA